VRHVAAGRDNTSSPGTPLPPLAAPSYVAWDSGQRLVLQPHPTVVTTNENEVAEVSLGDPLRGEPACEAASVYVRCPGHTSRRVRTIAERLAMQRWRSGTSHAVHPDIEPVTRELMKMAMRHLLWASSRRLRPDQTAKRNSPGRDLGSRCPKPTAHAAQIAMPGPEPSKPPKTARSDFRIRNRVMMTPKLTK
jgi:hypothetical protein